MMYKGGFLLLLFCMIIIGMPDQFFSKGNNTKKCKEVTSGLSICCADWRWDDISNKCIICNHGYMGINCSEKCPNGFHGKQCDYLCPKHCEVCDHVTGECYMDRAAIRTNSVGKEYSSNISLGIHSDAPNTTSEINSNKRIFTKSKPKLFTAIIIGGGSLTVSVILCLIAFHIIQILKQEPGNVSDVEMTIWSNYEQINESHMLREATVVEGHPTMHQ